MSSTHTLGPFTPLSSSFSVRPGCRSICGPQRLTAVCSRTKPTKTQNMPTKGLAIYRYIQLEFLLQTMCIFLDLRNFEITWNLNQRKSPTFAYLERRSMGRKIVCSTSAQVKLANTFSCQAPSRSFHQAEGQPLLPKRTDSPAILTRQNYTAIQTTHHLSDSFNNWHMLILPFTPGQFREYV